MVCRDLLSCKAQFSSQSLLRGYSKSLKEIIPVEYKGSWARMITYKRIKTELLTKEVLQKIFSLLNLKDEIQILETPRFWITQYGEKCPLFINRKLGRIYVLPELGYPEEKSEHQASILITILNSRDLIEDLHYQRIRMQENQKIKRVKE